MDICHCVYFYGCYIMFMYTYMLSKIKFLNVFNNNILLFNKNNTAYSKILYAFIK